MKDNAELQHLLSAALALPEEERENYIRDHTRGEPGTTERILAILDNYDDGDGELKLVAAELGPDLVADALAFAAAPEVSAGTRVGPFVLERRIGRGGMGSVYLARRDDPSIEQRVAIKFLHPGLLDSRAFIRFQSEEQILARLTHPGIARFYDASVTEAGAPYFVMEYVEGIPITVFCETNTLSIDERLKLFLQVCDAVQFAHQNLVVHRDLKPSNVFVTQEGRAKLLDFGVAKVLDPGNLDATQTHTGLMTPAYAAPEQLTGERITTAADVYGLGTLLYELLTGRLPHRPTRGTQAELIRAICEEVPERASIAVTRSGRDDDHTPERRWRKRLQGDLDAILARCLRKRPGDRYASAEGLAADIRRHLDGIPVAARRGSRWYRLKRWGARHKGELAVTAASVLAIVVALAAFAAMLSRKDARIELEHFNMLKINEMYMRIFAGGGPYVERLVSERAAVRQSTESPIVRRNKLSIIGGLLWTFDEHGMAIESVQEAMDVDIGPTGESQFGWQAVANMAVMLADSRTEFYNSSRALDLYEETVELAHASGVPDDAYLLVSFRLECLTRLMEDPAFDRRRVDSLFSALNSVRGSDRLDPAFRDHLQILGSRLESTPDTSEVSRSPYRIYETKPE